MKTLLINNQQIQCNDVKSEYNKKEGEINALLKCLKKYLKMF